MCAHWPITYWISKYTNIYTWSKLCTISHIEFMVLYKVRRGHTTAGLLRAERPAKCKQLGDECAPDPGQGAFILRQWKDLLTTRRRRSKFSLVSLLHLVLFCSSSFRQKCMPFNKKYCYRFIVNRSIIKRSTDIHHHNVLRNFSTILIYFNRWWILLILGSASTSRQMIILTEASLRR